ncbi:hypothetical protein MVES1_003693 [Malassezia vespertilionis]|uniref:Uncharacterized protein n=1 Tax=Malassezia vespertilionis TaxID=2020962 RepID=A0A2N1J8I1_9BASI|nr:uncharacterized protein MVES1_003693 [Malassezia vespertilionis]PKI82870.1 hypothetical protein MVES_003255 [Malassezia vespertilionis]WFD08321.1 hypothetical protein MVES1_003693 [Malassezia vespertilionis]
MWLVRAWFDGEEAQPTARILHTGRSYTLGRKEGATDLCIPIFRISRMAGVLTIGAMPQDRVQDTTFQPSISWTMHSGSKSGAVVESYRGRNRIEQRVRVETPLPLKSGARIRLFADTYAEVEWVQLALGYLRSPSLLSSSAQEQAALFGIHLVSAKHGLDAGCTHLCIPHVRPTKTQLLALVRGLPLVTAAFLDAIYACASMRVWSMPSVSLFLPPPDPQLPSAEQIPAALLAPSGRRAALFRGTALVLIVEREERRDTDLAELAAAAEAHVSIHAMQSSPLDRQGMMLMLTAVRARADVHWDGMRAPVLRRGVYMLCDAGLAPATVELAAAASEKLHIPILAQGPSLISECILEGKTVFEKDPGVEEDTTVLVEATQTQTRRPLPRTQRITVDTLLETRAEQEAFPPTQPGGDSFSLALDAEQEVSWQDDLWDEAESVAISHEGHVEHGQLDTNTAHPTSKDAPSAMGMPFVPAHSTPVHTPPTRQAIAEASPAPAFSNPSPTAVHTTIAPSARKPLVRHAGSRHRVDLMDEILGVSQSSALPSSAKYRCMLDAQDSMACTATESPTTPVPPMHDMPHEPAQHTTPTPPVPFPQAAEQDAPPASMEWTRLARPAFFQVRFVPLLRARPTPHAPSDTPNFKKFRTAHRTAPKMIPISLHPAFSSAQPVPGQASDDNMNT